MSKGKVIVEIYEKPNEYFDNLKMIYAKVNKPYEKRYYSVWLANVYNTFEINHDALIGESPEKAKEHLQHLMNSYNVLHKLLKG